MGGKPSKDAVRPAYYVPRCAAHEEQSPARRSLRRSRRSLRKTRRSSHDEEIVAVADLLSMQSTQFGSGCSARVVLPRLLEHSQVKLHENDILGSGSFGCVFRGTILEDDGRTPAAELAVKQLKAGSGTRGARGARHARAEFIREAVITAQLDHRNVVSLVGLVPGKDARLPPLMALSFCELGDLNSVMRGREDRKEPRLAPAEVGNLCYQIAKGMKYLASRGFVHRDLAARNVLVTDEVCCKIADLGYGQSPDADSSTYTAGEREPLPVRWCAPEALSRRGFSTASDVWSYGVVAVELFTACELPYAGVSLAGVMARVIDGGSPERPRDCPLEIWSSVVRPCFRADPRKRPAFRTITKMLDPYKRECPTIGGRRHKPSTSPDNTLSSSDGAGPAEHTYEYQDAVEMQGGRTLSSLTAEQIDLIDRTWTMIAAPGRLGGGGLEAFGAMFYAKLFIAHPEALELYPAFRDEKSHEESAAFKEHALRVFSAVTAVVGLLKEPDTVGSVLFDLGVRHARYNVKPEHIPWAIDALVAAVLHELGGDVPAEGFAALSNFLTMVAGHVTSGLQAGIAALGKSDPTVPTSGA